MHRIGKRSPKLKKREPDKLQKCGCHMMAVRHSVCELCFTNVASCIVSSAQELHVGRSALHGNEMNKHSRTLTLNVIHVPTRAFMSITGLCFFAGPYTLRSTARRRGICTVSWAFLGSTPTCSAALSPRSEAAPSAINSSWKHNRGVVLNRIKGYSELSFSNDSNIKIKRLKLSDQRSTKKNDRFSAF